MPLIVDAAVDAHRIAPDLHKVLNEQVPRVGQMAQVERVSAKIADQIERYLAARRQEVGSKRDLKLAALVIEASVEAVVHRAIVQAPGYLGRELRDELVLMLDRYLAPPRKDGTPRQGGHHVGDGSGLRSHRERSGGATGGGSGAGSRGR